MNRVNIILATYNGEKYIKDQIQSIINNGYTNWKLWIFDDGSTDKTSDIVNDLVNQYPNKIEYTKNSKNKGVTINFLEGLKFAASKEKANDNQDNITDYYMFCDQDDEWMPDKIEKTLRHMKKAEKRYGTKDPIAVFTDAVVADDTLGVIHSSFYKVGKLNTKNTDLPHIMMENKMIGCTVMLNDKLLQKITTIPANARFHDWWVAMIAAAFGHISYLPEATLFYRQHSNNVVGNQNFLSYVKNRITSMKKQKDVLHKTVLQASEFYQMYHQELPVTKKAQVYHLANIEKENWLKRRSLVIKYGYMKTGILRNIGLLWLV